MDELVVPSNKDAINACLFKFGKVSGDRSSKNALFANARSRALFPAVAIS